ncbi:cation efflux family-domain-containing protein [Pelagophyceae sp. CCMP2097]|nr:cation efflux family-domain-containing protein [Pelagophyceae sp. CCMP2097]
MAAPSARALQAAARPRGMFACRRGLRRVGGRIRCAAAWTDAGQADSCDRDNLAKRVTVEGAVVNVALGVAKLAVGTVCASPALISDAAHSLSDVASDGVTFVVYTTARQPPDVGHPWGHGKLEALGALGVGALLCVTAAGVGHHAVEGCQTAAHLYDWGALGDWASAWAPDTAAAAPATEPLAGAAGDAAAGGWLASAAVLAPVSVAFASMAAKEALYHRTAAVGRRCGSRVVQANAQHHRSDAASSAVALVGIVGARGLGLPFLDPLAGLFVAGMVARAGYDVMRDAAAELADSSVDARTVAALQRAVRGVRGVRLRGVRPLRARRSGPALFVAVTISVDGALSASAAHHLGEHARRAVVVVAAERGERVDEVSVHVDPDVRQELGDEFGDAAPPLAPTPGDLEQCVRAVVREHCSDVRGVTDVSLRYTESGTAMAKVDIVLDCALRIADAHRIATQVRRELLSRVDALGDVDVDLELNDCHDDTRDHKPGRMYHRLEDK